MYRLLESIHTPQDIKKLSFAELASLAEEIREFLIQSVSKTGGHLASNLGVVELTLSLFKSLDLQNDSIVWDVGHQSYIHKLLTGRMEQFSTLRQFGGMSGFPKKSESEYDVFNTGHSSTSISAALGMTYGAALQGKTARTVAVIGDGALTGGMAFEAMNNVSACKKNFIVILNDNEMSIDENVGSLSNYLTRMRTRPIYFRLKSRLERLFSKIPKIGPWLLITTKRMKDAFKHLIMTSTVFEDFGFTYFGPIDGHDMPFLCHVLEQAKKINGPVLLHVKTKKGKGYKFAEDKPTAFHGVGSFSVETGERNGGGQSFSSVFGQQLAKLAEKQPDLCAVTAAMQCGTGLDEFSRNYPERCFDVGIAEQHAVTFAAGLAARGLKPVVAVYSSFLQRAYDQILHDVCLQNLNVVFCIDRAGLVGEDGETHQGIYDLSFLSHMPNMTILAPADYEELSAMLAYAVTEHQGPIAVRYPRGSEKSVSVSQKPFVFGQPEVVTEGETVCLLSAGHMLSEAIETQKLLKEEGISSAVVNLRTLWPLPEETLAAWAKTYSMFVTIEDGVKSGGIGEKMAAMLGDKIPVLIKAHENGCVPHGTIEQLYRSCGLDAKTIAAEVILRLKQE
ncbi:MAG: 1-deoxy-D-xylulose-5-phosphate synthase [Clostridia bacterium]|nr:1-deoxy-D-xylulose-5-phosphate synthase [Clostridia bacterium]